MKAKFLVEKAEDNKRARDLEEAGGEEDEDEVELKKTKSKKTNKKVKNENDSSVIYLGHIPHGFFEKQMREFFTQFGTVVSIKHCRNPKTLRSRGYAFIKFEDSKVATEVVNSVNGYFLKNRQLKCMLVPKEKQHDGLFKYPKKKVAVEIEEEAVSETNEIENQDELKATSIISKARRIYKQNKKQRKLNELGIDFDISNSNVSEN